MSHMSSLFQALSNSLILFEMFNEKRVELGGKGALVLTRPLISYLKLAFHLSFWASVSSCEN